MKGLKSAEAVIISNKNRRLFAKKSWGGNERLAMEEKN